MPLLRVIVTCILLCLNENVIGQRYLFQNYGVSDGLAFQECRGIVQDKHGFIWISHTDGLSRFDGYNFKIYKYNPNDPATSNLNTVVAGLMKDPTGEIFVMGSNRKLHYKPEAGRFIPLPNVIAPGVWHQVLMDPANRKVWVGTHQQGLYAVDSTTKEVTNFLNEHPDPDTAANRNDINSALDFGSSLLLATLDGLWVFDKATSEFERPRVLRSDVNSLFNTYGIILLQQKDGTIWFQIMMPLHGRPGLRSEFLRLDKDLKIIDRVVLPESLMFSSCLVYDNAIWLGNAGQGLYRVDIDSRRIDHIMHDPSDRYSILSNTVNRIVADRDGNLWVSTDRGISVLRKRSLNFFNKKLDGRIDGSLLYESRGEELFMISQRTLPVVSVENQNKILVTSLSHLGTAMLPFVEKLPSVKGYAVEAIRIGKANLWMAVPGTGVLGFPIGPDSEIKSTPQILYAHNPTNANTIGHRLASCTLENDSVLWVSNKRTGLDMIDKGKPYGVEGSVRHFTHSEADSNSIQEDRVFSLYFHGQDSIWVVTDTGLDLMITTGSKVRFKHVLIGRDIPLAIHKTDRGSILLGTTTGLYHLAQANGQFVTSPIWTKSGVTGVAVDKMNRLWIYGSDRLGFHDPATGVEVEFNEADGIDHTGATNSGNMHRTRGGQIILVDREGISAFDPASFSPSYDSVQPALVGLTVNNIGFSGTRHLEDSSFVLDADIVALENLELDYQHNSFSVEFSAMQMTSPEKNRYRHKLEGFDPDWIETDAATRTATYTNLDPGTYEFKVAASNHHGVWNNNERTLYVVILPPPWRTWWAYSGYSFLVAGLLVWARRNIVQRERLKSNLKLEHIELEKAKEVDRVKTSFFANISHEFRTPLTLIKGPVQDVLEKYQNDELVQGKLKLVQRNSDLLLKLINQLLDLSKLEAGTLKVEKSDADLFGFIRSVSSSFESLARQKGVDLKIDIPASLPASFDKDKVETIIINLVNNAIKFTQAGGTVTVTCSIKDDILTFEVADTGIGIPVEKQDKIFERFYQVSETHKEVGTGIGLALVKELVALLGGKIEVNSETGMGSTFIVTLHIEPVSRQTASTTPAYQHTSAPATDRVADDSRSNGHPIERSPKPVVLVVEDNTDLRHFIIDCLGEEFDFLQADNGRKGLETATNNVPDLIISDVMMPEMDGITMTSKLKADVRTSHIPLILLTAKSTEDSKLHGLSTGADDYLTKPFNKNELLLKVRNSITRQQKLREKLRADLISTAPKVSVLSADEQFLDKVKGCILARLSDEQLSVESLAEEIGMSRVQLYRKVTALTGLSVNELIRKLRLQRAAQLLEQKWGPVSQVAYEVGFSNLSYFSKVFKEEFNILPSEYEANR
jgi:signal transduction histidine kinase/DNA-binding response OmpR family regulator